MSWPLVGASVVKAELYKRLQIKKGVTAIIGSGGKTSLINRLCRELPGTVIVCTSTRIFPPEELPLFTERLGSLPASKLCVGTPVDNGKLTAPVQSFEELAKLADYVLVEADGSKHLPLKAHAPHEPVIPACANQVIQVLGISGVGRPICEAAHRPERYAELCGAELTDIATLERAANVLNTEALADRYVLNQADDLEERKWAMSLAALLERPCVITSMLKDRAQ